MDDIEKIRRILVSRNQNWLANLLSYSEGELSESSTYGHYLFSTISTYYIKSPPKETDLLNSLSEADKQRIYDAVIAVYPHKEKAPEITHIEYLISFDCSDNNGLNPDSEKLETFNIPVVYEQFQKCSDKIERGDYEGAVTNARSLLESLCKYILKENDVEYKYSDDLEKNYKAVSKVLKMEPGMYKEVPAFQQILTEFFSIINGISFIRNHYSDSHGLDSQVKYRLDKRHALLVVNAAKSIANYLLEVIEKKN